MEHNLKKSPIRNFREHSQGFAQNVLWVSCESCENRSDVLRNFEKIGFFINVGLMIIFLKKRKQLTVIILFF